MEELKCSRTRLEFKVRFVLCKPCALHECSRTRLEFKAKALGLTEKEWRECSRTRLEFKGCSRMRSSVFPTKCSRTRLEFKVKGDGTNVDVVVNAVAPDWNLKSYSFRCVKIFMG